MARRKWVSSYSGAILPLVILSLWEGVARANLLPASHSAPPSTVVGRFCELVWSGVLPKHLVYSLGRLLGGLLVGTIVGVASGVLTGMSRRADKLLSPTVGFLAGLPVVVWMPFWVLVLGSGEVFKVGLGLTATYFLVHIHTFQAVRSVGLRYVELAEIYEKPLHDRIRQVLLPSAVPSIITAARISVAVGWIVIFFVEYAASQEGSEGLGWFIADARQIGRIEDELAGFLLLGVSGYLLDCTMGFLQRQANVWRESLESRFEERGGR